MADSIVAIVSGPDWRMDSVAATVRDLKAEIVMIYFSALLWLLLGVAWLGLAWLGTWASSFSCFALSVEVRWLG